MSRFIHLNGLPGVGKSTLARMYADDHPGSLVLDLDVLAGLIGGWRTNFSAALDTARELARPLAERRLRAGHDVVFPQLVTVHDRDPDATLETAAQAAGANYIHVVLTVDEDAHLLRLRNRRTTSDVEAHVQSALSAPGSDLVDRIRAHLHVYLSDRLPDAVVIDSSGISVDQTYERLLRALDANRQQG